MAHSNNDEKDSPGLKRQLGIVSATSYITGTIIGVGIFISPTSVLEGSGSSLGVSLLVWTLCGAITFCGAMSYAEYGSRVGKSGGTYTYIREAFGDLAGFVFLWAQITVVRPLSVVLACLASAEYIMRPLYLSCPDEVPVPAKVTLGFVILGIFVAINMYSVRGSAWLQIISTICKVVSLLVIIVTGLVYLCQGHTENFKGSFEATNLTPGGLALAIYAGIFAFGGWEIVNNAVEEVINPSRTIPMAIIGGLMIPTVTYILAIVAYHAVLTNEEILSGVAVAVAFGERRLGLFKWMILPCVAISSAGIANSVIFSSSRLNFAGGRDGLFPRFLGMVNHKKRTPQPSIILLFCVCTIVMCVGNVKSLLGAFSFYQSVGECVGVMGFSRIRRKHPATKNTYTVHWIFPVIYAVFFVVLSVTAIAYDPAQFLIPLIITLLGVPVYFLTRSKWWKRTNLNKIDVAVALHGIYSRAPLSLSADERQQIHIQSLIEYLQKQNSLDIERQSLDENNMNGSLQNSDETRCSRKGLACPAIPIPPAIHRTVI